MRGDLPFDHIAIDIKRSAESSHHVEYLRSMMHAMRQHMRQCGPARELPCSALERDTHHLIVAPFLDNLSSCFLKFPGGII